MYRYRQVSDVVREQIEELLNKEAESGWELASTYTTVVKGPWDNYYSKVSVILRRDRKLDNLDK